VREEALEAQFTDLLGRLKFDDEVLEWVTPYVDKLDGVIEAGFFEKMSNQWRICSKR
jgi:site-specific DNA recombinase